MTKSVTKRNFLAIMVVGLLLLIAAPTSFGQGRRNGRDRDWNNNWSRNRKCAKFVNCHDARDGRVDGRGPRADRVAVRRNRNRTRWSDRNRNDWMQRRAWARRHRNHDR
jgi:hypothetical protein